MKNTLSLFVFFVVQFMVSQDLTGKWAMIIDDYTFTSIECPVIEITHDKLMTYSFDTLLGETKLEIDLKNKLFIHNDGVNYTDYHFTHDKSNFLLTTHKLSGMDRNGNKSIINNVNYVKLLPTVLKYPIDSIINKQYEHFYSKSIIRTESRIKFKGVICEEKVIEMVGIEKCPRYRLEKLDETYFIVYYPNKDHKMWMVPVKEVNRDYLLIYGLVNKKGLVKLHEIKEIRSESKLYIPNK
ncbi:hypothetical protein [Aquimarina intermedia]|uniref:DUF3108 domain-containing protein n=1 Tax=Aquimarina intermedia TaxID=350814 RepID=A0A5S5C4C1_9FLAO|nr:hypothetical protein [Aquimarina intermedia]TYP73458.1 hypothetical protein BD809_10545 [Aquimarina intermedia]